jgi:hypothetical protein
MHAAARDFPWADELEKTVVNSLVTSFGLDFLLFKDQKGGNVNTIHNVRNDVWANTSEKQVYDHRGDYNSKAYHQDANYIATGQQDNLLHTAGTLHDPYRTTKMGAQEKRNLDHVISAKDIHDDPGRVLAGIDGVKLANQSSNLQSTQETVNKSKSQSSIDAYLLKLPGLISTHEATLARASKRLASLPRDTPEQQHKARELESKISRTKNKIVQLKAIDPDAMRKRDAQARAPYNQQINYTYYTSSKFIHQTAKAAGVAGLGMGTRQMLGMVMAEIWFELREQLPTLLAKLRYKFSFEAFVESISASLKGIWARVQARFSAFLIAFKEGVFAGVLGSLTTTLFNILATTQVMAVKIIREVWGQLVKAIKLIVFNPDQLSFVELCQAVTSLTTICAATAVGSMAYTHLLPICSFPFGAELAAFASALLTGVVTLGLNYFLLHSSVALKLWGFIESLTPHAGTIKQFQTINAELDRYLTELSRLEFNLDVEELQNFVDELESCNSETQRSEVLRHEVKAREIAMPYEIGNADSTRSWLASLI